MGKKQSRQNKAHQQEILLSLTSHFDEVVADMTPHQARIARERAVSKMKQAQRAAAKMVGAQNEQAREFGRGLKKAVDPRGCTITEMGVDHSSYMRADFFACACVPHRGFDKIREPGFFDKFRTKMGWPQDRALSIRCEMIQGCRREPNSAPRMYWLEQARQGDMPHITHFMRYAEEMDPQTLPLATIKGFAVYQNEELPPVGWVQPSYRGGLTNGLKRA